MALLALIPGGNPLIASIIGGYGIFMDLGTPYILTVNASSLNNGTIIECTAASTDMAVRSSSVVVNVFGKYRFIKSAFI